MQPDTIAIVSSFFNWSWWGKNQPSWISCLALLILISNSGSLTGFLVQPLVCVTELLQVNALPFSWRCGFGLLELIFVELFTDFYNLVWQLKALNWHCNLAWSELDKISELFLNNCGLNEMIVMTGENSDYFHVNLIIFILCWSAGVNFLFLFCF